MMKSANIHSVLTIALVTTFLAPYTFANDGVGDDSVLTLDQKVAGICVIANQGVYTVALARQAGQDKPSAKKTLDKDFAQLQKSFTQANFLQGIKSGWYQALDDIYQMPVLQNQEEKEAFVSELVEVSYINCVNQLSGTP